MSVRYSFTSQFIAGAVLLSRRASAIEGDAAPTPELRAEHKAFVAGAVMQASAALEAEASEVLLHGPGHHLGSDRLDLKAQAVLSPLAEMLDRQPPLDRYGHILHVLGRQPMNAGHAPHQNADLLVELRNGLTHYKSHWGGLSAGKGLLARLQAKRFKPPPWVPVATTNFFPHQVLGAACARWAAEAAAHFIDAFYDLLGIRSVLDGHRAPGAEFAEIIPRRPSGRGK